MFWALTINHAAMRIAAPAFIYSLCLLDVQLFSSHWQRMKYDSNLKKCFFLQTKWNITKLRKKHSTIMPKENAFWNLRAEDDSSSVWCSFVLLVLYAIGYFFDLDYLEAAVTNRYRVLLWCILVFCSYFWNVYLQVASSEFQVLKVLC
jgi:hypothetical protein